MSAADHVQGLETAAQVPCITIGITCYNAQDSIRTVVSSALQQDWSNIEVVVVDDASSDDSWPTITKLATTDKRIHPVRHETNQGAAGARNTILKTASGEFIAFFDDDDVSHADRIRLQYEHIIRHEEKEEVKLIACYASGKRVYPNGYTMPLRAIGSDGLAVQNTAMADYLLFYKRDPRLFYGSGTPTCSLMARRLVFQDVGGFDVKMRRQEDVDFAVRLSQKGGHFIGIPHSVLTQYATTGNDKSALVEFESFLRLLEKNKEYLLLKKSYHYMKMWSEMRYWHFANQDIRALLIFMRLIFSYPIRTLRHFSHSAIRRFTHEQKMKANINGQ